MLPMTLALTRAGYPTTTPERFYRGIFGDGELDKDGAFTPGRYVGIAVELIPQPNKKHPEIHRYTLLDDMGLIDELQWHDGFCFMSPISYAGKRRVSSMARYMYALCIEVDHLVPDAMDNLAKWWRKGGTYLPCPTYVVASGSGLHLYFKFERPVPMYKQVIKQISALKKELTTKLWNKYVTYSHKPEQIQYESIFQAFRVPGTRAKNGERTTVHEVGGAVTLEYLNGYVSAKNRVDPLYKEGRLTLREAKEKYPEWYERRVIEGKPRGQWAINRRVYEWWRQQIEEEAAVGHRYYCLMLLAVYAIKCSMFSEKHNPNPVTEEELEQDLLRIGQRYIDEAPKKYPFDESDMLAALQAWHDKDLFTYPINSIANRSGKAIEKNIRHGQKQADHLEEIRAIRDIRCNRAGKKWDENNGRKKGVSKERQAVIEWHAAHPNATRIECAKAIGVCRQTVARWWNDKPESLG